MMEEYDFLIIGKKNTPAHTGVDNVHTIILLLCNVSEKNGFRRYVCGVSESVRWTR